ncbi:MAG: GAF domain-containing protein [Planctomycetes bacterium]|nr:GAF domain-containing protein [Planctomycetota bacterium]
MELPTLVVIVENKPPIRLPIRGELVLGRDPECSVAIDDGYLSRRHCMVACRGEQVVVKDMSSYNGTWVNGQRIHEECFVLPGDVLKVGRTRMFVDFGDDGQSASLHIYAANLEHKTGVQPVAREKAPELAAAYQGLTGPAVAYDPTIESSRGQGPQTRRQRRQVRPDDKTPIPPAPVTESAVNRSRSSSGQRPLSREREGMRALAQITRALASATDVHEFLDYVLSRVLEVIPAERGLVMRLDPERRGLYAECVKSALPQVDDQTALRQGISHTIARKVVRERVSVLVDDAVLDQRFKQASSVQDLQIRSILCVPLWLGERISGLIYLDHMLNAYAFTESDRDLLVAAANLAALGLERLAGR